MIWLDEMIKVFFIISIDFKDSQFEHKKPWLIFKYTWIDAQKWAWTKSDAKFEIKTLGLNAESVLGVREVAPPILEGSSPTKIKFPEYLSSNKSVHTNRSSSIKREIKKGINLLEEVEKRGAPLLTALV